MTITAAEIATLSPCDYADALPRSQFVNPGIRPLWSSIPRIAGKAFTVYCEPGDHLMVHAAIYQANPGDILVIKADQNYAVAGGNVCAIAQKRGIVGMVVDGMIRDLAEVREARFPVFARGVIPKPGVKKHLSPLNQPIDCGGVTVHHQDWVVADEEGIAIIPKDQLLDAHKIAKQRAEKDAGMSLEQWQAEHEKKVASILQRLSSS